MARKIKHLTVRPRLCWVFFNHYIPRSVSNLITYVVLVNLFQFNLTVSLLRSWIWRALTRLGLRYLFMLDIPSQADVQSIELLVSIVAQMTFPMLRSMLQIRTTSWVYLF